MYTIIIYIQDTRGILRRVTAGSDEKLIITPPIRLSLEQALEFINDDELVEITPKFIRVRKRFLKENERKRAEWAE